VRAYVRCLNALSATGLLSWSLSARALTACPEGTRERPLIAWATLIGFVAVASFVASIVARRGLRASTTGAKVAGIAGGIAAWLLIVTAGAAVGLYLLLNCY
jgi:hypothetical protein